MGPKDTNHRSVYGRVRVDYSDGFGNRDSKVLRLTYVPLVIKGVRFIFHGDTSLEVSNIRHLVVRISPFTFFLPHLKDNEEPITKVPTRIDPMNDRILGHVVVNSRDCTSPIRDPDTVLIGFDISGHPTLVSYIDYLNNRVTVTLPTDLTGPHFIPSFEVCLRGMNL